MRFTVVVVVLNLLVTRGMSLLPLSIGRAQCLRPTAFQAGLSSSASSLLAWRRHRALLLWASLSTDNSPSTTTNEFERQQQDQDGNLINPQDSKQQQQQEHIIVESPWRNTRNPLSEDDDDSKKKKGGGRNKSRFRQHVNPLARRFQVPTDDLSDQWPHDVYDDPSKPLVVDIGCGKGGFLCEVATAHPDHQCNYLGLEIRPSVVQHAQQRIGRRQLTGRLDFVGCNANVDLDRILQRYRQNGGPLERVLIQFPDPHFKKQHTKRRVVTPALVETIAKHTLGHHNATVFLQSDIQPVLDSMRHEFRCYPQYFTDEMEDPLQYLSTNPMGIPTEREISVLEKNLPVYRTVFRRTNTPFVPDEIDKDETDDNKEEDSSN